MQLMAYLREVKQLKFFIIPILIVIICSYSIYNGTDQKVASILGREDGFYEWGTFFLYFVSFLYLILTYKSTKIFFILMLSLVMLFGACEEVSWGQRIVGFETPENIKKENVQGELTIHNLELFNPINLKGEQKEGFSKLTDLNFLFKIFNFFFGIGIPLGVFHFKAFSNMSQKIRLPVPPVSIGMGFVISWIGLKYSISAIRKEYIYLQEPAYVIEISEFNNAFIMAMISLYFYTYSKKYSIVEDIKQSYQ